MNSDASDARDAKYGCLKLASLCVPIVTEDKVGISKIGTQKTMKKWDFQKSVYAQNMRY